MVAGKRVLLRPWQRSDIESFLRWFNDPEVTVYLSDPYPHLSREQEEAFYEQATKDKNCYCIVTKDGGKLIGNCSFNELDLKHRSAMVGIVIGEKEYWGRGYGREALELLLEIGFDGYGLHRIALGCGAFNERGLRCYAAAGFVEEGRRRDAWLIKGVFHDLVLMSILEDEYRQRRSALNRTSEEEIQ